MHSILVALLLAAALPAPVRRDAGRAPDNERATFTTTLGRDTVAVESFTRTASHLDGKVVIRVPGTVLCHYTADIGTDGAITRTVLDITPMGTSEVYAQQVRLDFVGDSVRVTTDSSGYKRSATRVLPKGAFPFFMTGFGSSYGLYSSIGMYELFLAHVSSGVNDTTSVRSIDMATARTGTRQFIRRSPTLVDVDYFNAAWTGLTVDAAGHVTSADASGTTEQTQSRRTAFVDVEPTAAAFAAADRAGRGLGAASANTIEHGTIGAQAVVVAYGRPLKRGRVILGNVVRYDHIWRTGANEATTITFQHDAAIGGATLRPGTYSLWTLPMRDGTVLLVINRQHGQWGTEYDPAQDILRVPMQVASVPSAREDFTIEVTGSGTTGELRISWDTFVWTVPVTVK